MRFVFLGALLVAGPAFAQSPAAHESCVDVKVGSAQSYECLNQRFRAMSEQAHQGNAALQAPPYSAGSPPNQTGQFDQSATAERLGTNFGKSVTPQRPATHYSGAFARPH